MIYLKYMRRGLLGIVFLALATIITVNIETLAEAKGWSNVLTNNWDPAVSVAEEMVNNTWFWAVFWFVCGATAGTWLTYFSYRDKASSQKTKVTADENLTKLPSHHWRSVDEYTLWQIAHLWVLQEPRENVPPGDPAYPIFRMLKADVANYKLLAAEDIQGKRMFMHAEGDRKDNVDLNTQIKRATLLHYISNHKEKPLWDFESTDSEIVKPGITLGFEPDKCIQEINYPNAGLSRFVCVTVIGREDETVPNASVYLHSIEYVEDDGTLTAINVGGSQTLEWSASRGPVGAHNPRNLDAGREYLVKVLNCSSTQYPAELTICSPEQQRNRESELQIPGDFRVVIRASGDGVGRYAEIILKVSWNGIEPKSFGAEIWPTGNT